MNRTATIAAVLLAVALGAISLEITRPTPLIAKAAMPDPALTGAPSEGTCFTCHNGGLNDVEGLIVVINAPSSYTPGQTYTLAVALGRGTGSSRWGFELTALTSGNQMAGTLNDMVDSLVGKQTLNGIQYVSQTTLKGYDGTYSDSLGAAWFFQWTAPPVGTGAVTFYAAGAACDKDNSQAGDFTYTTSLSSAEGAPTAVETTTWGRIKQIYR